MTENMTLSPQRIRWYIALNAIYITVSLVDIVWIPNGNEWRWVNFSVNLVKTAVLLATWGLIWPRRWVYVSLVIVWVASGLLIWPQTL